MHRPHKKTSPHTHLVLTLCALLIAMLACAGTPPAVEMYEAQRSASNAPGARDDEESSRAAQGDDLRSWDQNERLMQPVDPDAFDGAAARAAIFYATNEHRRAHNLPELDREYLLEVSSQLHADRMRKYDFFAHDDPHSAKHRTPSDRARLSGISNPYTAENIAIEVTLVYQSQDRVYAVPNKRGAFTKTPGGPEIPRHTYVSLGREVLVGWMNSPGHRKNILNPKALSLGCGAAFTWQDNFPVIYAVQNFQFHEPIIPSE